MSGPDASGLYQGAVLEHGNTPRREGPLPEATHQAKASNPLCGDRLTARLVVDGGVITRYRFEARGCLLTKASASLLGELVEGQPVAEARRLLAVAQALTRGREPPADLGPLAPLGPVRQFPARVACVELAWKALGEALGPA